MTEKEILEHQQQSGNTEFYLMLIGKFLNAYGHGAFALSRATGYRVLRKVRKNGDIITAGFPIGSLDMVRSRIRDAGGYVEQISDKLYRFGGIDGTPDEQMVQVPAATTAAPKRGADDKGSTWLAAEVLGFNLSMSICWKHAKGYAGGWLSAVCACIPRRCTCSTTPRG